MPVTGPSDRRRATALGALSILMWSALALLTVSTGTIPPFQLAAMTFAIGATVGGIWIVAQGRSLRDAVAWPPRVWLLGVGGLFGYHLLYFIALRQAPAAEANLINYLWPLLIVLLSAPIAGEPLHGWHLGGAALGLAGIIVLTLGRGEVGFAGAHWPGYLAALGCAVVWSVYSVTSRRFGEVPTDAVAAFCAASSVLAALCHVAVETTVWPSTSGAWLAVVALGIFPVGAAFYVWDVGMKRGDIRALGALSYATPILSTALLIATGRAAASPSLLLAAALVVGGAVLAGRDLWRRAKTQA
ncbi:DMT family transporter [Reyranella sp. CPCC 100927]|uniref:aromatic amino acid exporter YddG n=1 Tax=Reyranella sp. CPCC 100927 TaxID=2599616 RepID=UPI0011B3F998|nr:EamA family transporter [Reyranella sp. CPCC 100927]TWT11681.1 EamA family transporter [Reyranella sp. CPCC 100927]